ncbi:fructosamine kinase family protein [Nesterenkonia sp. HG001]|uniref:fructosamine kinase family protein n=1 Tax=Nesterenkonia sp. HG001 TaxID=2983207 RepID=UPI002AC74FF7|nr:fructosamine kinase family protein [Nesterenkonia sp. HG001]MDZ5076639.1 fructosamine kinase family protein [Nesterenkonia sp. HG001]
MSFRKASGTAAAPQIEAAGLRWLAEAVPDGGAAVARVLDVDEHALTLEAIVEARPDRMSAAAFGAALARTHRSLPAGTAFGALPPEHPPGEPPLFGPAGQLLPMGSGTHLSWGSFLAAERLDPLLERLTAVPPVLRAARDRIASGDLDGGGTGGTSGASGIDQATDHAEPPSRLHGDLWSGNLLWRRASPEEPAAAGSPGRDADVEGVLIDPFAHAGHRESDVAMMQLFGLPHLDAVVAGYQAQWPLAPGWEDRVPAHQLFYLLGHWVLFGDGYAAATLRCCETTLAL